MAQKHTAAPVGAGYNRNGGLTLVPMPGFAPRARAIADILGNKGIPTDIAVPKFHERASGEPYILLGKEHVGGHDCVILTSGPGTYRMLMQLQLLLFYLSGRRAGRISLFMGYMPLSRSEKPEGAQELALEQAIIQFLEAAVGPRGTPLDRIIAVDLHAESICGMGGKPGLITEVSFVRRVLQAALTDIRAEHPFRKICILFPDATAQKRYEGAVEKACAELGLGDLPSVFGIKRRNNSASSRLLGLAGDTHALRDAVVVSVDDEIATGGTNRSTAIAVTANKPYHAHAYYAVVTHGVLCGRAHQILAEHGSPFTRVYISDTIPVERRHPLIPLVKSGVIQAVCCLEDWANVIRFHHRDVAIRELR